MPIPSTRSRRHQLLTRKRTWTPRVGLSDIGSDSSGEDMDEAYTDDICCAKCKATDREELMILCDGEGCNSGWHTFCLTPMLPAIPDGDWLCPTCEWVSPDQVDPVVVLPVDPAQPSLLSLLLLASASLVDVDAALTTPTTTPTTTRRGHNVAIWHRRRVKHAAMWKGVLRFRPWMRKYHTAATGGFRRRK
mmetsp:Transcript_791/g.1404  ORF Transcript_791/g.1404 Transcript_791/m.1404 type:complete len:191 (+) Transcript_791:297-869(+)